MNIILLSQEDFLSKNPLLDSSLKEQVRLSDARAKHIYEVHQAEPGRRLKVGVLNGKMGFGEVLLAEKQGSGYAVEMSVHVSHEPPAKLPLTVVLALPRPKMLRRIVQHLTALGVVELVLINSYRVEKSYWQSPFLHKLDDYIQLGLEQAVDTVPMKIRLEKRFKPFVEDELPSLIKGSRSLVAHPYVDQPCPRDVSEGITLAIGPEGGFIEYEVNKLIEAGFEAVTLGSRIQKVETVLPLLIGRLF
jgi:RsmE family RNA methyltransferase